MSETILKTIAKIVNDISGMVLVDVNDSIHELLVREDALIANFVYRIEDAFGISLPESMIGVEIKTVGDLAEYIILAKKEVKK